MEGGKQSGSSFTSDLFGSKDSSAGAAAAAAASSSDIFGSIFAPPAKVNGTESKHKHSSETEKKQVSGSDGWNNKTGVSINSALRGEDHSLKTGGKDSGLYYPEEKVQPFHYSSSIYYGGQDYYFRPQTAQNTVFTTFNKDGGEDDSDGASRGNWWLGSLHY